jgi:hypothetical protein
MTFELTPASKRDYLRMMEDGFVETNKFGRGDPATQLEYLSDYIFKFETYDSTYSELFAKKALEVCAAISDRKTFEYIEEPNNELWYLLMCNMPFFVDKIECGTSIRSSWWQHEDIEFSSCGLWDGARQMSDTMTFTSEQWREFISAARAFAYV